ncbi:MAG: hypothetical protein K6F61_06560 [Clostridiales bacterium]|nr:hypothetical protein [Clostridiales bacterium]
MGEYYDWVNVDKKQYLIPMEFGHGSKLYESCWYHADVLGALYSLLSSEWKGDHIMFLGDECGSIRADIQNETLRRFRAQCTGDGKLWYWPDEYRCMSGLFKAAEKEVREEIRIILEEPENFDNIYRIDPANPYKGLFEREPVWFRYVVNHARKEYYDTERTRWTDGGHKMDPLPLLLAYGRMTLQEEECGRWLGAVITVTDQMPGDGYTDLSESNCWESR